MHSFSPIDMKSILTHLPPYTESDERAAFLLGGIGTGNVAISSSGRLVDWELYNKPGKGNRMPYQMFCLHTQYHGHKDTRLLEAQLRPPYDMPRGQYPDTSGLPRMKHTEMRAEYPFCMVDFFHDKTPVQVTMEAYTPFIPLNSPDSGIPGAIIRFRVRNPQQDPVYTAIAATMPNMTCPIGRHEDNCTLFHTAETCNTHREEDGLHGIFMTSPYPKGHILEGTMALCTTNQEHTLRPALYRGNRRDCLQDFWNDFSETGALHQSDGDTMNSGKGPRMNNLNIAAVAPGKMLAPGEEAVFQFIITWHIPNRLRAWDQPVNFIGRTEEELSALPTIRNYFAVQFADAWAAAVYLAREIPRLEKDTLAFHRSLFSSTYPPYVLDALSANITALRSPTCFRLENGLFQAWEGCDNLRGSCHGTCTHVWNYAQTVAFLFPELEISARYNEFTLETEANGKMNFRATKALNDYPWNMPSAVDGQCGTIIRACREWKFTGDNKMMDDLGENILHSMDYCIRTWDDDEDGVLSGEQHNTYDIEFFGINSLGNTMYLAALLASAEIADYLGKKELAEKYRLLSAQGAEKMDALLWNGEYYNQKISPEDMARNKYQYGNGCLSDQVIGQYMAHTAGLGHILPADHLQKALDSIYRYNFSSDLGEIANPYRVYAIQNEPGLLLCTWPLGGRPRFPFYFCDEVWTGIEYQVAACLIWEGRIEEGLQLVQAVRSRYEGKKRNPFDEIECGHHYARSMASWALLPALSGFQADLRTGKISFAPQINADHFSTFYSTGKEWGVYTQERDTDGRLITHIQPLYTV